MYQHSENLSQSRIVRTQWDQLSSSGSVRNKGTSA